MIPDDQLRDFKHPSADHNYRASVEPKEVTAELYVRLFKDVVVFIVAVGFVVLIAWLCVDTLLSAGAEPEEKKWAMSVLSAAAGGIIGYLVKR